MLTHERSLLSGKSDNRFDWWIEQLKKLGKSSKILSIIGSDEFLSAYARRSEFSKVPVAFVGNREMWLFKKHAEGL